MLWTIIGVLHMACPAALFVAQFTSMHTKPHLLNARARGLHCVYVSLVLLCMKRYNNSHSTKSKQHIEQSCLVLICTKLLFCACKSQLE